MRVTRRQFLGCTAAAVALRWRLNGLSPATGATSRWAILDLGHDCSLRESLTGYTAAFGTRVLRSDVWSLQDCTALIVPAAVRLTRAAIEAITACLDGGGLVILETGVGFASAEDFAAHRVVLRDALDVQVDPPVALWPQSHGAAIPYVEFTWPIRTRVRDFSRVVPVESGGGEIIARVNGHAAGIRRRRGRGTLLALGSPLGPALWAGDSQAQGWLEAVAMSRGAGGGAWDARTGGPHGLDIVASGRQ